MKDLKLRKALVKYCEEEGLEESEQPLILDNHEYDESIIGISSDGRLIYDYDAMIEEFARDEGCSIEEAQEWVDYNTIRALPYIHGKKPIIMTNKEFLMFQYYDGEEEE